jgi:hypothetical protein
MLAANDRVLPDRDPLARFSMPTAAWPSVI